MADNEEFAEQIEDAAPEETPETPGQETVYGAEVMDFINRRKEELGEDVEDEGEPSVELGDEEEVQAEAPEEPPKESASRTARRALQKEKRLRAEREALQNERETWQTETEAARAKLEAYEKTQAEALMDPLAHLAEIGLSEDDLMNVAREIYYKHMPEQANPAVQAEMAAIQRERRLKKLEAQGRAKPKEEPKAPEGPTPEYQAYEREYTKNLTNFAANMDAEEFPLCHAYAKEDFNDLVQGMFNAAVRNAKTNTGSGDLTPDECMAVIEDHLRASRRDTPPATQSEEAPTQKKKAKLRNKSTAQRPNEKHEDEMTYEEITAEARRRFNAVAREKGLIR